MLVLKMFVTVARPPQELGMLEGTYNASVLSEEGESRPTLMIREGLSKGDAAVNVRLHNLWRVGLASGLGDNAPWIACKGAMQRRLMTRCVKSIRRRMQQQRLLKVDPYQQSALYTALQKGDDH